MSAEQRSFTWMGWAGILLGIGILVIQAKFLGAAILDLAFHIPLDPAALAADVLIVVSILFLIWRGRK